MQIIVMPAWIAGIQVRKDAFGDVHVDLDSSTPCRNDVMGLLELTEAHTPPILKGENLTGLRSLPRLPRSKRKHRRSIEQLDSGVQLDEPGAAQLAASGQQISQRLETSTVRF